MTLPVIESSTREEILHEIDKSARVLLDISGEEFMRRYYAGELEHAPVEDPIIMLADLVAHSSHA